MCAAIPARADILRIATFNTELSRKGPGILFRDIVKGSDPQVLAVIETLVNARADVVALQGFDYDLQGSALTAFAAALKQRGLDYPHRFSGPPNAGLQTDVDLDGDGQFGGPGDAQGYGRFFGHGSMAILSRFPIARTEVQDFSTLLWKDLPDNLFPQTKAGPFPSSDANDIQRLSSHGHWVVPIDHPDLGRVHVLTFHASPPVFDGPQDRNGRRNHDEVAFWSKYLDGAFGTAPDDKFILMGDANLDPKRGDSRSIAMQVLLKRTNIQDPLPDVPTVHWEQTGDMRVDYVLPSADWRVMDAEISPANTQASRHRMVILELKR